MICVFYAESDLLRASHLVKQGKIKHDVTFYYYLFIFLFVWFIWDKYHQRIDLIVALLFMFYSFNDRKKNWKKNWSAFAPKKTYSIVAWKLVFFTASQQFLKSLFQKRNLLNIWLFNVITKIISLVNSVNIYN